MRENRTHGSEGGESGPTGLPYPYQENPTVVPRTMLTSRSDRIGRVVESDGRQVRRVLFAVFGCLAALLRGEFECK